MRPIKFRGKPKMTDKQQLVYGWGCYTDENERYFILVDERQFIQVEKIDEFTGLHDRNGKEIWEGDVVIFTYYQKTQEFEGYRTESWEVDWMDAQTGWSPMSQFFSQPEGVRIDYEVIGNIYQDSHLLTK